MTFTSVKFAITLNLFRNTNLSCVNEGSCSNAKLEGAPTSYSVVMSSRPQWSCLQVIVLWKDMRRECSAHLTTSGFGANHWGRGDCYSVSLPMLVIDVSGWFSSVECFQYVTLALTNFFIFPILVVSTGTAFTCGVKTGPYACSSVLLVSKFHSNLPTYLP